MDDGSCVHAVLDVLGREEDPETLTLTLTLPLPLPLTRHHTDRLGVARLPRAGGQAAAPNPNPSPTPSPYP